MAPIPGMLINKKLRHFFAGNKHFRVAGFNFLSKKKMVLLATI
jgi:hypothetical protein